MPTPETVSRRTTKESAVRPSSSSSRSVVDSAYPFISCHRFFLATLGSMTCAMMSPAFSMRMDSEPGLCTFAMHGYPRLPSYCTCPCHECRPWRKVRNTSGSRCPPGPNDQEGPSRCAVNYCGHYGGAVGQPVTVGRRRKGNRQAPMAQLIFRLSGICHLSSLQRRGHRDSLTVGPFRRFLEK